MPKTDLVLYSINLMFQPYSDAYRDGQLKHTNEQFSEPNSNQSFPHGILPAPAQVFF